MTDWISKRHVVADGDLPEQKFHHVLAVKQNGMFFVADYYHNKIHADDNKANWVFLGPDGTIYYDDEIKYWWPLPEVEGEK